MQNYKQNTNIYFKFGYFTQLMAYWKWENAQHSDAKTWPPTMDAIFHKLIYLTDVFFDCGECSKHAANANHAICSIYSICISNAELCFCISL